MQESKRKKTRAVRRAKRVRARILGVAKKPRLSVFRSARHTYAQIIDDSQGATLMTASTVESHTKASPKFESKVEAAKFVGKLIGACLKKLSAELLQ